LCFAAAAAAAARVGKQLLIDTHPAINHRLIWDLRCFWALDMVCDGQNGFSIYPILCEISTRRLSLNFQQIQIVLTP
jgi:hypothetical protein